MTQDQFITEMTRLRGIDFARLGMAIEVNGARGHIVGLNSSANLDVVFDDAARFGPDPCNCHPTWETLYLNESGEVVADYRAAATCGAKSI